MSDLLNGTHSAKSLGRPMRVIVFEYYDCPLEGVIQFADGGVYRFKRSADSSGDYDFAALPPEEFDRIVALLAPYITPAWPIWVPVWRFPSQGIEDIVNESLEYILDDAGPWATRSSIDFSDAVPA